MNVTCNDRERIFLDGTPDDWAALEVHAATCAACTEELRAWKSLSLAAAELRDDSPAPELWPRIQQALAEQALAENVKPRKRRGWFTAWVSFGAGFSWQTAVVSAFALLLLVSGGWLYFRSSQPPVADASAPFLKSTALAEVERTENAYIKAIDKLAAEAKPQLDDPDSPLLANYREKLQILDSAIDDLRAQAGLNPSNAHLRHQLLAMYQEKQQTLEEVLEAKSR
jgi:hypothetical protein